MDLATIVGLVAAFGLILISIGKGFSAFIDGPSAMIVFGGTFGAALVHYRFKQIFGAISIAKKAFTYKALDATSLIKQLVEYASQARREGILALETAANETEDAFLKRGLQLAVDGHDIEAIQAVLETEIEQLRDRHKSGAEIFAALAGYAPALGMIGTLVGLVLMLQKMDDPSAIGPAMAVALLTTFYGAVLANVIFNPIAGKLRSRSAEEVLYKELAMEGVLAISLGDNPRVVEQKLTSFLEPRLRELAVESK
ncbi:MAG: MotA/TolQ/ExbB proton channel family protein [Myxococcales bacterium]|nr:MotA/TolQ/ExbB proton channel family protein [Myxococcales bacterium]